MSEFRIDQITNQAGTAGPQVAGITTFSSTSGLLFPSGPTEYRGGRGRGVVGGGINPSPSPATTNALDYFTIATTGNTVDFGDLTVSRQGIRAVGSSTRGVFGGGSNPTQQSTLDFVVISSGGGSIDFGGQLTFRISGTFSALSENQPSACSNNTRGIYGGGYISGDPLAYGSIVYITIPTGGNSAEFGELSGRSSGGISNSTRGIFQGIQTPTTTNAIEYITISTLGDSKDFGDLTLARSTVGGCSNNTRGVMGGGSTPTRVNTIDYITISSLGDAQDFGDLTEQRSNVTATANSTRGVWVGGSSPNPAPFIRVNIIDYVTIASTGDATDFGDLTGGARSHHAACSDAHGGLGD